MHAWQHSCLSTSTLHKRLQLLDKHASLPTSLANVVINTKGRAVAISVNAWREDLCESAAGDSGKPLENEGWWYLLSGHSSRRAMRTAETSIYGSQSGKPRPIRSMAARRMDVWDGKREEWGLRRRNMRALLVKWTTRGINSSSPGDKDGRDYS